MSMQLCRYATPITADQLPTLLKTPGTVQEIPLGVTIDLTPFQDALTSVAANPRVAKAAWDRDLIKPLHQAIKGLSRREACDMRLWHWLCIKVLPDYVWRRWGQGIPAPEMITATLEGKGGLAGHFLGAPSLVGVSRNALARLWWSAEVLSNGSADYSLAKLALERQDLFVGIFERAFCLYPPAARACVRALSGRSEEEQRKATKRLNHLLTTTVVELLDEDELVDLLQE